MGVMEKKAESTTSLRVWSYGLEFVEPHGIPRKGIGFK